MNKLILLIFLLAGFFVGPLAAWSSTSIEFPDDELATETVLPQFDRNVSVLNRKVKTRKKTEAGLLLGVALNEPFFNQFSVGAYGTYHFNEFTGIHIYGLSNMGGLSNNGESVRSTVSGMDLDFAPATTLIVGGDYQRSGYYGKMSVAHDWVMNLILYGLAGGGLMTIGDTSYPFISAGLGQKFYFTSRLSLRFDLRGLVYEGPNPVSYEGNLTGPRSNSEFGTRTFFSTLLNVGLTYLF